MVCHLLPGGLRALTFGCDFFLEPFDLSLLSLEGDLERLDLGQQDVELVLQLLAAILGSVALLPNSFQVDGLGECGACYQAQWKDQSGNAEKSPAYTACGGAHLLIRAH
jgi:hypothetical protein